MLLMGASLVITGVTTCTVRFITGIRPRNHLVVRRMARRAGQIATVVSGIAAPRVLVTRNRYPARRRMTTIALHSRHEMTTGFAGGLVDIVTG